MPFETSFRHFQKLFRFVARSDPCPALGSKYVSHCCRTAPCGTWIGANRTKSTSFHFLSADTSPVVWVRHMVPDGTRCSTRLFPGMSLAYTAQAQIAVTNRSGNDAS